MDDVPFHANTKKEYGEHCLDNSLREGIITEDDAMLIRAYAAEYQATRHVSDLRIIKCMIDLANWRRYIKKPWRKATITDIHTGIETIKHSNSKRGKPFKRNTLNDYVKILRWFVLWMIENEYSSIQEKKIKAIKNPGVDYQTTEPDGILSREEVAAMITAAKSPRNKAMISLLYETGARIGELARLRWRDIHFDENGARVHIIDTKTEKTRYNRIAAYVEHLATWKAQYPGDATGDNLVFIDMRSRGPMLYRAVAQVISRSASAARIEKRVHPHLMRKTRITHLIGENYQESAIKQAMWGNVGTNMMRTYAVISEQDIDNEFLGKLGLKSRKKEEAITPAQCPYCYALTNPDSKFCYKCGRSLTAEVQVEQEDILKKISLLAREDPETLIKALSQIGKE
jgi:site-specific recombinase XerD